MFRSFKFNGFYLIFNDNFKTARHYFLLGNMKKSKEYFDKINPSNALIINVKDGAELNENTINKNSILNPVNTYQLTKFYQKESNLSKLLSILNGDNKISLRIIDWFVTNYAKKKILFYILHQII